jgi:hypothetical protein
MEIEQDAIAELDRLHEAQRFTAPSFGSAPAAFDGGYGMSPAAAPMGFPPLEEPQVHRRHEEAAPAPSKRDLRTLEDLYDAYPEIGDGSFYMRVERKHPTRYGGQYIAGFIADLHEQITMHEFAQKFGGQVYEVSVRGPGRSSTLDSDGRTSARTLTTITIKVPGVPVMDIDGANGGSQNMGSMPGFREDPRVTMKRMEHDADALRRAEAREARLRQEVFGKSNLSPELMQQMTEMAERRAQDTRSASAEIITDLRDEKRRLMEAIREREAGMESLRQKLIHVQTEVQQRLRDEETRQIKELKLHHEGLIARMKDDHASTIQRIQQEHERRITEMTERHTREYESVRQNESRERERLRDDANRREKGLQDDFNRREQSFRDRENSLKDDFARREEMIRRDYEMRFQQLERSNKRDLEMIKSSESTKSELATQTAVMQANLHMAEITRLQHSTESAEQQAAEVQRELNKHTNKPLLQQVEETKVIAETLGLLDKKDEDFDWRKGAVGVFKELVGKAPDIAKGLGDAREQNRMAVTRAQHASQHAQQRAEMQRRRAMGQAGVSPMTAHQPMVAAADDSQQRHVPRPPPPPGMGRSPRTWDAGPPEPTDASHLPPEPAGPPVPEAPPPSPQAGVPKEPLPPPITGGPVPPIVDTPSRGPHEMPVSEEVSSDMPEAPEAPAVQVTEEQVARFSEQLESAISSGIVSPGTFAEGFIEETSPETALAIISAIEPDQLVDAVAAQEGAQSTAIVTREGRKYVQELWLEAEARARKALGVPPPEES